MPDQPPLNQDGVRAAEELMIRTDRITKINYLDAERIISAYLAAALPEVTSVEELDQLPVESVVRDSAGIVYENDLFDQTQDYKWARMASGGNYPTRAIILPAHVLYRPDVKS